MIIEAFWDSSVLVPLCADQPPGTALARKLLGIYAVGVWWGTPVEVTSALMRLRRSEKLTGSEYLLARTELEKMQADWLVIQPSDGIKTLAVGLLEKYPLRAGDAFQLAAAMEWCEGQPMGQVFLTADKRLAEAAGMAGFSLDPELV
jgi:predicted nucleic acid-binding protein